MFYKLSLRNVSRSFKDYSIYFLTLTFAVAVFYTFNSVESQKVMIGINAINNDIFKSIAEIIQVFSVFVAIILGFLIIYANGFLIKRRKKELGIYSTLGMSRNQISKILLLETILIGFVSLVAGLVLGGFASQGLSIITMKMFKSDLSNFKFILSTEAIVSTAICFSLIFLLVILFNVFSVSRYKLIDLINASKKNEELKANNKYLYIFMFVLSVIIILVAYRMIIVNGLLEINNTFYGSIVLGILGTFLFFMSISQILISFFKSNDKMYLKGLNLFVVRQISSKVNSNFISTSIICLMLFVTICVLSSGLGINMSLSKELENRFPYDGVITGKSDTSIIDLLRKNNINIDDFAKDYAECVTYDSKIKLSDMLTSDSGLSGDEADILSYKNNISVIKLSQYNELLKLQGKKTINLKPNTYTITAKAEGVVDEYEKILSENKSIKLGENILKPNTKDVNVVTLSNMISSYDLGVIVVNDKDINNLQSQSSIIGINYKDGFDENDIMALSKKIDSISDKNTDEYIFLSDKQMSMAMSTTSSTIMAYLSIYIGVIFLITSGAILALKQLSEATDNIERYSLLRKIGVNKSMINKSIFTQVGVYFMMPLLLAVIHSVVGLKVSNEVIREVGRGSMINNIIISSIFICFIYGTYFIATYISSKNIINNNKI